LPWSERDGYARLDGYFDLAPERFRQPFIVLDHALHDEADDLIDVPQRFFAGATPSGDAPLMQGSTRASGLRSAQRQLESVGSLLPTQILPFVYPKWDDRLNSCSQIERG
jgi:hypothetical protein